MSILGFLNKTSGIIGDGRVAINDLKVLGDKAQDLLSTVTSIFNSALGSPIENNSKQGFGSTGSFGSSNSGFGNQQQGFSSQGFASQPAAAGFGGLSMTPADVSPVQNTFKRSYRMENINTLSDALDATAGQKNFNITYGKYGRDAIKPAYTIASNIFLYYTNNTPTLHFNMDAKSKGIRDDKKIKLMESLSALLTFIETMFSVKTTQGTFEVGLKDNNIAVDFGGGTYFTLGTLALMKYRLGLSGYSYGSSVIVDDCIITVSGDYINITKQGFLPVNVSRDSFISILDSIPALKYTNINESDFVEYQDNPKGLTTRMIIELNRATNKYEIITYEDIQLLDTYAGTQIKNSLLGTELKRSEGQNIV